MEHENAKKNCNHTQHIIKPDCSKPNGSVETDHMSTQVDSISCAGKSNSPMISTPTRTECDTNGAPHRCDT